MLNKSIGILGGSFDPIHLGHIQSAQSVAVELGLSKVLLIPAHISPHKTSLDLSPNASPTQRADMVELACQNTPIFNCDKRELNRAGCSYTVDTLEELTIQYPSQPLNFIIGMDSLLSFTRWHQYQKILSLCHIIVNTRPNYSITQMNSQTKTLLANHQTDNKDDLLSCAAGKIYFAKPVLFNVSSTKIRENIKQNKSNLSLLLPEIEEYIDKNKLYR